jgi:hypothetical protein
LLLVLSLAGCATGAARPAPTLVGCAQAVVDTLPAGLTNDELHCLASAGIARRCSRFEAWLAGWGKEARDALDGGDASWSDLRMDRLGRRCAAEAGDPDADLECCRRALAAPSRQLNAPSGSPPSATAAPAGRG